MYKSTYNRFTSVFVAFVMLLTTNALPISVFADASTQGVGIYNHVMTTQDATDTKYVVRFYKKGGTEAVAIPNEMEISGSKYLTPAAGNAAVIYLSKDETIDFRNSTYFREFVKTNQIDQITITYEAGELNQKQTSLLYGENTQTYKFWYNETVGEGAEQHTELCSHLDYTKDNPFEGYSDVVKTYNSTTMKEVPVEQTWRDRGNPAIRPQITDITFDIYQNAALYIDELTGSTNTGTQYEYTITDSSVAGGSYKVYLEMDAANSSTYLYTYTVPEYAENGQQYSYSSVQADKASTLKPNDYIEEDTGKDDHYLAVGLTDFNYTMKWADAYDNKARPEVTAQFINENFTLYRKIDATTSEVIQVDPANIVITANAGGVNAVSIKKLEDINENGTANEYYLALKNQDKRLNINADANLADKTTDANGLTKDYYAVKSENIGLHVDDIVNTYEGGEISLRLTGTTDFTGNIVWDDIEEAPTRQGDTAAATFDLWRYSGTEADFSTADAAKYGDPATVDGIATVVTFGSGEGVAPLDKYDLNGQLYTYYALESVTVEKGEGLLPYQITYQKNSTDQDALFNNGTVTNKLSDRIQYTVSASWTAAARQGGTASATYELQRKLKTATAWENVQEITLTFDELHMSRKSSEDVCKFDEVDMYDEHGNLYEYRVVQTSVSRTDELSDENVTGIDYQIFGDGISETSGETEFDYKTELSFIKVVNGQVSVQPESVLDKYDATLENTGNNFDFHYQIKGDTVVNVTKNWVYKDGNGNWVSVPDADLANGYQAQFDVQNFSNNGHEYKDYFVESDYPDGYFDEYLRSGYFVKRTMIGGRLYTDEEIAASEELTAQSLTSAAEKRIYFNESRTILSGSTWSVNNIAVPKYDNAGREIAYRAVELRDGLQYPTTDEGNTVGYYQTYGWNISYTGTNSLVTNYNYTITNHRTYPGNDHREIAVNKVWVDDGELEYRKPINIIAVDGVGYKIENGVVVPYGEQQELLNQGNVWEGRIDVSQYKKDSNNQYILHNGEEGRYELEDSFSYNSENFREAPQNPVSGEQYYWSLAEIEQYMSDLKTAGSITVNPTDKADGLEWIYNLLSNRTWNYTYTDSENNNTSISISPSNLTADNSTDLTEQNFIKFADFAGIYKSKPLGDGSDPKRCHYYAVRQVYTPGGVNGADGTLRFINTRIGVISYEVQFDWNVGDALTKDSEGNSQISSVTLTVSYTGTNGETVLIEQLITPDKLLQLPNGNYAYYLLNLPKYDLDGKLIDYTIKEIKINDSPVTNGEVNVGSDHCKVTVSSEIITEGSEAKSDDLHTIIISNTFEDKTNTTVHKRWVDNSNAEYTRPDLYIKLYRVSENPAALKNADGTPKEEQVGKEYKWVKDATDTLNYWTYLFEDFPKYDSDGYKYTYYVKEQEPERMPQYKQEYSNIANNPDVYVDANSLRTDVAYNNGTIINRLYGETTVNGEKLWKNMAGMLQKKDYPIAYVTLYKGNTQISDVTEIRSGATSFKFSTATNDAISGGLVITEQNDQGVTVAKLQDGNIVLPKYDELGRRITYTMKEEPINGYISKIEQGSQKLINEYNGGRKLQFTVNKHWEGMTSTDVYPTIKFTLHQVFRVEETDAEGNFVQYKYYEFNHFDREVKVTQNNATKDFSVTFGDAAHPEEAEALRYYSPIGEPYTYFVTETLSNYDGEQVLFIENADAAWIPEYIKKFNNNGTNSKAYIEYLDSTHAAEELGFISQVTNTLDSAEDAARVAAINSIKTEKGDSYTPSEEEITEQISKELKNKEADALSLDETVQNTYKPDNTNFHGIIDVSKTWHTENNDPYNNVTAYSFTVSRKTKQLDSEELFTVNTVDTNTGGTPTLVPAATFELVNGVNFQPSSSAESVVTPAEGQNPQYYIAYVKKDSDPTGLNPIKVIISVADSNGTVDYNNHVTIKDLAVYGQDALKYYYTVEEIAKPGYTKVKGKATDQLVMDHSVAFPLENRLDVFDLTVYKSFGREYEEVVDDGNGGTQNLTTIQPIPKEDFPQFFNDDYFKNLKYHLYRRSTADTTNQTTPLRTITGTQILNGIADTNDKDYGESGDSRFGIFRDLPKVDKYGNYYTYWIEEEDPARTAGGHVSAYYSLENDFTENRDKNAASADTKVYSDKRDIELSANDKDTEKKTYVQNVFEAKKISINKYWLDNNNEDGLRPNSLEVTIYEQVAAGSDPITFTRVLKKESSTSEIGWTLEAALARYYFNGTGAVSGLEYKIGETEPAGYELIDAADLAEGASVVTRGGATNTDPNTYTIPGIVNGVNVPLSDTTFRELTAGTAEQSLNLTNYKKPQKGELTLTKALTGDTSFEADTRPEHLYFKLTDENGVTFTDYTALMVTVTGGTVNLTSTGDKPGLITVDRIETAGDTQYSYPVVTVSNLPINSTTGAVQQNGSQTAKQYKFVECDADGNVLTGSETFPYTWAGKDADTNAQTVRLNSGNSYAEGYQITNTLKTTKCQFTKNWIDENNIYNTRKALTLQIQRKLETPTDTAWTPVTVKPANPSTQNGIDVWTAQGTDKTDTITQNNPASDLISTQSGQIIDLPLYNAEGVKYQYRVRELKIGDINVNRTYQGHDATATFNYFVVYENTVKTDGTEEIIKNEIIKYQPSQDFIAHKNWTDNRNQDKERPASMKVYLVQREWTIDGNSRTLFKINSFEGVLNESNDWTYEWKDYPGFSEEGHAYTYAVVECYDRTQHVADLNDVMGANVATDTTGNTITKTVTDGSVVTTYIDNWTDITKVKIGQFPDNYNLTDSIITAPEEKKDENNQTVQNAHGETIYVQNASLTNTHDQYFKSLTVNKQWLGDENYKAIRPESITYELYCKYTAYKYKDDSHSEIVADYTYDGPVSGATALLSYYEGNNEVFSNRTFQKTWKPADHNGDKENDADWENKITFSNLPVYINTCADSRWNGRAYAIQYYVKEVDPTLAAGKTNPYTYGQSAMATLLDETTPADKNADIANELKTRPIQVTKVWDDNGYGTSLHYPIDFTLSGSGADRFSYSQMQTLSTSDFTVTFTNVPIYDMNGTVINYSVSEKVHSADPGVDHAYCTATYQSGYYISRYSATNTVAENYVDNMNTASYTVTPSSGDIINYYVIENTLPVKAIKADKLWDDNNNQDGQRPETLNFTLKRHVGTETDAAVGSPQSDTSTAHYNTRTTDTNWAVDFGIQPIYAPNNAAYIYSITEEADNQDTKGTLADRGYVRYVGDVRHEDSYIISANDTDAAQTITNENGTVTAGNRSYTMPIQTYHFKNVYVPHTDSLQVTKAWNDTIGGKDYHTWTRPDSVNVTLYYKLPNGSEVNLATVADTDPVKAQILAADSSYSFSRTLQGTGADPWKTTFTDLPIHLNPTGTAVYNGASQDIQYYVKETSADAQKNQLIGYTATYSNSNQGVNDAPFSNYNANRIALNDTASLDEITVTNTLNTRSVTVTKNWNDNGYVGDSLHYDIDFTLASIDDSAMYSVTRTIDKNTESCQVTFANVPKYDKNGKVFNYSVSEKVHSANSGVDHANCTATHQSGYYISSCTATPSATVSNGSGDTAYTVFPAEDNTVVITGYTIENKLPVVQIKADKEWDDNNNQDGKRPADLHFQLYRRIAADTDSAEVGEPLSDGSSHYSQSSNDTKWKVTFSPQPQQNAGNQPYLYSVAEDNIAEYRRYYETEDTTTNPTTVSRTYPDTLVISEESAVSDELSTDTTNSDNHIKVFHFKNAYTPTSNTLTVQKIWRGDDTYRASTRPDNVVLTLYCKYGNYDGPASASFLKETNYLGTDYAYTKEISKDATTQEQTAVFTGLPVKVNPTGNKVYNGQEYVIEYYVKEAEPTLATGKTNPYRYGVDYDAQHPAHKKDSTDSNNSTITNLTDASPTAYAVNELKTRSFEISKQWNDSGVTTDTAANLHYSIDVTLKNTAVPYDQTRTIEANSNSAAEFLEVPYYFADGTEIVYEVTEKIKDGTAGSKKYNYTFSAGTPTKTDAQVTYTVTNTLDVVNLVVTKNWQDLFDGHDYQFLRPDSLNLTLQRRLKSSTNESDWTDTPIQPLISPVGNNNARTWTYTYSNLLRYDADNNEYAYRVVENLSNSTYTKSEGVSAQNETNPNWSQEITNTLKTRSVTITKVWANDSDYTDLRYDVHATMTGSNTGTNTIQYAEQTIPKPTTGNSNSITINNVPVYNKDGAVIPYTVEELEKTIDETGYETAARKHQYGYHLTNTEYSYDNHYQEQNPVVSGCTLTNTLPLTSVKAVKHWAGDLEMYPNASAVVNVSLTRSSNNTADTAFNADTGNTKQIIYKGTDNEDDDVTFEMLLVKDQNNKTYSYTITEQTVQGYKTTYTNQTADAEEDKQQIVTVTNTPILYRAEFVKYDVTDYDRNNTHDNFSLVTLANAQFKLHRVLGTEDDVISVTLNADGTYSPATAGTATITSDSNGYIKLTGLQPNEYYLIETAAPAGYQSTGDTRYYFKVIVDTSNQVETQFNTTGDNNIITLTNGLSTGMPDHGIPNEETGSHLKLTKEDEREKTLHIANAYYYLLRLYDYEYRKDTATVPTYTGTDAEQKAAYLQNAITALEADYNTAVGLYWEKVGDDYYQTDEYGVLQATGNAYGIYVFYEVKAPAGYDINNNAYSNTVVPDNSTVLGPVEFHAGYTSEEHDLIHYEPRKDAQIKILKTDEFGNPLKDATFELYQTGQNGGNDVKLATVTTGYDGMNTVVTREDTAVNITILSDNAIQFDTSKFDWNTEFYFLETTAPNGYSNLDGDEPKKITFNLTREVAEEPLHIVRADDARLKGKVTLTKIASEATSKVEAGAPLQGAEFDLYKVGNTTKLNADKLTTGADGTIAVENLEWGDYYFVETKAPVGFKLPTGDAAKVYFTVGRSNCGATAQQLTMENEPETASLNIIKHIDNYDEEAWGKPSFIFKITQTKRADGSTPANPVTLTKIITPTSSVTDGFEGETGIMNIEPGTYTITEMQAARYTPEKDSAFTKSDHVSGTLNGEYTAAFTITANGEAEVKFFNKLTYYDKFSHADSVVNTFNGYKAIRLSDKSGLELTGTTATTAEDHKYTVTIRKSELAPLLVKSDGTTEAITDYANLTISTAETGITVGDATSDQTDDSIIITGRKEDVSGSIFKMNAAYKGFTTSFELRFKDTLQFSKTEKTVTFLSDGNNLTYYSDGATHTLVYSLDFIIETATDGATTTHTIKTVLHDGVAKGATDKSVFPTAQVDTVFASKWEFDQWEYAYGTTAYTRVSADDLLTVIQNAPDHTEITVRPVLKAKS